MLPRSSEESRQSPSSPWRCLLSLLVLIATGCQSAGEERFRLLDAGAIDQLQVRWEEFRGPEGTPTVALVNMVHLGEEEFFLEVQSELEGYDLVFMEGVKGGRLVAELKRLYGELAAQLGMTTQSEVLAKRKHFRSVDVQAEEIESELHDVLIRLNLASARMKRQVEARAEDYRRKFPEWEPERCERAASLGPLRKSLALGLLEAFVEDEVLIQDRNRRLLVSLDEALESEGATMNRIAVCYGAGHAAGIESWLRQQGFQAVSESWQTVFHVYEDPNEVPASRSHETRRP
jgi:hypothetical protein